MNAIMGMVVEATASISPVMTAEERFEVFASGVENLGRTPDILNDVNGESTTAWDTAIDTGKVFDVART